MNLKSRRDKSKYETEESPNRFTMFLERIYGLTKPASVFFLIMVLSIIVSVVILEIWARYKSHGSNVSPPILSERNYYPYLENIKLYNTSNEVIKEAGYTKGRSLYQYKQEKQLKYAGERFEAVFQDRYADAKDLDSYRIFFIGGSVASGVGAGPKERYFEVMETMIHKPYSVKMIPAAIPAITSSQENILFHLTVLPNKPDFVVIFDGWNDVNHSAMFSIRPGDPPRMSALYSRHYSIFYNFQLYLASISKLYEKILVTGVRKDMKAYRKYLIDNDNFRNKLMESIVNVYLTNVEQMIVSCKLRNIPVLYVLQPSLDTLFRLHSKYADKEEKNKVKEEIKRIDNSNPWASDRFPDFIADTYERISEEIARRPLIMEHFVDLQDAISVKLFIDPVHFDERGHRQFAKALLPYIEQHLPDEWSRPQINDISIEYN